MNSKNIWCFFLILSIAKVCQGQLMCYVCDDCIKVTAETPQFECNEDFFNNGGTTESSIQTTTTTTELTKTTEKHVSTTTTETSTTTEMSSSTKDMTYETTTDMVNETTMETTNETSKTEIVTEPTVETSTIAQPPTPPTVGPPMTTTALPTPPNPGNISPIDNVDKLNNQTEAHQEQVHNHEIDDFDMEKVTTKAYKPSAEFRVRQLRSVSDFTYHCFKIHATTVNGTMVINRGCSRVQTMESVCGQWEAQHPNEQISKCFPCTRSKCNGSSALSVSITALFVVFIAIFMHRK